MITDTRSGLIQAEDVISAHPYLDELNKVYPIGEVITAMQAYVAATSTSGFGRSPFQESFLMDSTLEERFLQPLVGFSHRTQRWLALKTPKLRDSKFDRALAKGGLILLEGEQFTALGPAAVHSWIERADNVRKYKTAEYNSGIFGGSSAPPMWESLKNVGYRRPDDISPNTRISEGMWAYLDPRFAKGREPTVCLLPTN